MNGTKPVAVVVGVGPGNGTSLAIRFAKEGYRVALLARSQDKLDALARELDDARGYACDVASEGSVAQAFASRSRRSSRRSWRTCRAWQSNRISPNGHSGRGRRPFHPA